MNVAVQFPLPHDPIHLAAKEHKASMEMILRDLALRAGARDPIGLGAQMTLLMEGAYVTRQVTGSTHQGSIARTMGRLLLDQHLPVETDGEAEISAAAGAAPKTAATVTRARAKPSA